MSTLFKLYALVEFYDSFIIPLGSLLNVFTGKVPTPEQGTKTKKTNNTFIVRL